MAHDDDTDVATLDTIILDFAAGVDEMRSTVIECKHLTLRDLRALKGNSVDSHLRSNANSKSSAILQFIQRNIPHHGAASLLTPLILKATETILVRSACSGLHRLI
jgi:hypothetical protein